MEALEFLKEHKRICNAYSRSDNGCCDCPLVSHCIVSSATSDEEFKKMTDVVEQWSKEHPRKTRQSKILEQFPNARLTEYGAISVCPRALFGNDIISDSSCRSISCNSCENSFWLEEVD